MAHPPTPTHCITAEPAQTGLLLFLTRYWLFIRDKQNKIATHVAKTCAEERTMISRNTWNQSLSTPWNQSLGQNWNLNAATLQKQRVRCLGRLGVKPLTISYHKWPSSKAPQLKRPCQCFRTPACSPQTLISCFKAWIGRQIWALPLVSLPADPSISFFFTQKPVP